MTELSEPLTSNGGRKSWDVEKGAHGDDPYFVFREDLLKKVDLVDEGLHRFLRIVDETDTAVNGFEVKDAKKQLKRHIKNAESTHRDVQATVRAVEQSRDKFCISDVDLYERRTLVQETHDRITHAKKEMNSDNIKHKMYQDEREMARRRCTNTNNTEETTHLEKENTAFIVDSHAKTSLMLQQQDETLEELDDAVVRVSHMAGNISEELNQQNKMLKDFDDDLTDAEEKLGLVMGKLAKLLKTKSKVQLGLIVGLTVFAIVLLFLVIYT